MKASEHLVAELELVGERLAALPPAHQAECPGKVSAQRTALLAYQESLEARLSTAIVEERRRAVEDERRAVENTATTTRAPSATRPADHTGEAV